MEVLIQKRIVSRAETQRAPRLKTSAARFLCGLGVLGERQSWFRPKAGLGKSALILRLRSGRRLRMENRRLSFVARSFVFFRFFRP
jgi:hypothetical protein